MPLEPAGQVKPLLPSVPTTLQRRRDDAWLAAHVGRQLPDPFDVLFERHWAHLRTYCLGILGSADEAQDAAQEAMMRAYRRLWRAEEVPPVKPLLFAIARNTCIDRLRERSRNVGPVEEHHLPVAAGADEVATRRGAVGLLVTDLRALSERQRSALVLRAACDLSYDEISETLHTTPARVKSLISEARQALEQRRAGHELSCEDYRRGLARTRGRVRNQNLLAHRSTCARCNASPSALYALGLPVLGGAWLLRAARGVARMVGAPAASPTATKLAIGFACIGTAATPAARALDPGGNPPAAKIIAHRNAPVTSHIVPSAHDPATRRAARPAASPATAPSGERRRDGATGTDAAADRAAARDTVEGPPTTGTRAPAAPLPDDLRTAATRLQQSVRDVPRRLAATAPTVRRAASSTVRDVVRPAEVVVAPVITKIDPVLTQAAREPAGTVGRLLG